MKYFKYIKSILVVGCITLFPTCSDFLDKDPNDQIYGEEVFTRYTKVDGLVSNLYYKAKMANRPLVFFRHFSSSVITDECEASTAEKDIGNNFNRGAWNEMGFPENSDCGEYWWSLYEDIRQANLILEGVEQYKTPDNPNRPGELNMRLGETYFMRAYFHFLLIRMYGEVFYADRVYGVGDDMEFYRESLHDVVDKIENDAKEAFSRLPDTWGTSVDFGRVDKGACLGLIAMSRWIAATPLWNGGNYPGTRLFEEDYKYSPDRWVKAKEAADAVLKFKKDNGELRYKLYTKHTETDFNDDGGRNLNGSRVYARLWDMFHDMESFADEALFVVTNDKSSSWQGDVYPPSRSGSSRQMPVQEQVDEYEYIAPDGYGYPIYSSRAVSDGYDDENPYYGTVKRDPRFYRDIIYHGCPYRNNSNAAQTVDVASGSNKIGATNATTTGYYLRKFHKESWNKSGSFNITAPAIWRLPEIIYIYCEAVNNISGPTQEIYDMINKIRERSFMAPMPPEVLNDGKLMFEYIQRERRVELFYENHRVWATRLYLDADNTVEKSREELWLAAGSTNDERSQNYFANNQLPYPRTQRMINGMRPVEDAVNGKIVIGNKKYRMERFFIEERMFITPRHYLFPLMQTDIRRCPTMGQNPGWGS